MKARSQLCLFFAALLTVLANTALAKYASPPDDENSALIVGCAGEKYPISGVGGIRVIGGHHGHWSTNIKTSPIQIDGSSISSQRFQPVYVDTDFSAAANGAYFVSKSSVCTLSTASGAAGQEIVVCNTSKDATITYQTVQGEVLRGGDQSGPGKVDRFISDGKGWYRE